ncbi:hypothetical protein ACWEXZ_11280 [Staphylococcus xylosus]|nr:hypothetical protein [Staphylococcus xylosus]
MKSYLQKSIPLPLFVFVKSGGRIFNIVVSEHMVSIKYAWLNMMI